MTNQRYEDLKQLLDPENYFKMICGAGNEDEENIIFLRGGLVTDYGINVAGPGDIVSVGILKVLTDVFEKIENNTIIMVMRKND